MSEEEGELEVLGSVDELLLLGVSISEEEGESEVVGSLEELSDGKKIPIEGT